MFNSASCFSQEFYCELVQMFSANVFRALETPLVHNEFEYDFDNDDDEDTFEDPAWCHLSPIYTILLKLFLSPNFQKEVASLYIDTTFTSKLIDMIDSPNLSERNMVKQLLFFIYEKLIKLRPTIRKQISNVLLM
jgi:serine/threonine-protein phosphatase 2A regulatory subunit B'